MQLFVHVCIVKLFHTSCTASMLMAQWLVLGKHEGYLLKFDFSSFQRFGGCNLTLKVSLV